MNHRLRLAVFLLAGFAAAAPSFASLQQAVSLQARQYSHLSAFPDRPFADGDIGYGVAYELHDEMGFWQLGARYTPNCGVSNAYDYAITPFLNIFFKDRIFLAGFGIEKTYTPKNDTQNSDWSKLYYNFILGLDIPIGTHLDLQGLAFYDFDRFDKLKDFKFSDVEFAVALILLF